jgi:hypothetical protein
VRSGEWQVIAVTVFENEAALNAAMEAVAPLVHEHVAPLATEPPARYGGPVLHHLAVKRAGSPLDPALARGQRVIGPAAERKAAMSRASGSETARSGMIVCGSRTRGPRIHATRLLALFAMRPAM